VKFLFETVVTGDGAEEFAVLALPPPCPCMAFTRGDANNSNTVDIADMIYLLSYLHKGAPRPSHWTRVMRMMTGRSTSPIDTPVYMGDYLHSQVDPKPPLPFGLRGGPYFEGLDPTPDALNGSCGLRVANFGQRSGIAMRVNVRIRCE